MTELLHITPGTRDLAPGAPLRIDPSSDQLVRVTDGVLYVRLEEHDVVLLPGDSLTVPAGESRRAWNAGDEAARVVVSAALRLARAA
ncbi:MAG: Cupin [Thermoleophilaceae bacterium]|jgi:quercetin dioxygenase-like cupin family protein|nr:Cupin [Thermoleophilaceae bacterium]